MRIYHPSSDDDDLSSPNPSDVKEFARRLQEEREDAVRRPQLDDDAWRWFLSLFSDRRNESAKTDERSSRRVA
jgi:hypothetical protein